MVLTRRAVTVAILAITVSGCATLKPRPPGKPPKPPMAQSNSAADNTGQGAARSPPRYPYQSRQCTSLNDSQKTWGLTSKGLAVVAGGMAVAGAIPIAALLVGASSAGLGFYADYKTADYVTSCTTGNAPKDKKPTTHKATRQASDKLPPLTFSGVLTIMAGMLSAI